MRYWKAGAGLAVAGLVVAGVLVPRTDSTAAEQGRCTPPPMGTDAYYDFVSTYRAECGTQQNWDRTFGDVTVSTLVDGRNRLAVTSSTALAGAIASVKVNGREFIASGGRGAAFVAVGNRARVASTLGELAQRIK